MNTTEENLGEHPEDTSPEAEEVTRQLQEIASGDKYAEQSQKESKEFETWAEQTKQEIEARYKERSEAWQKFVEEKFPGGRDGFINELAGAQVESDRARPKISPLQEFAREVENKWRKINKEQEDSLRNIERQRRDLVEKQKVRAMREDLEKI